MNTPEYKIVKNESGERAVKIIRSGQLIPADIAGLCVGKDFWLSQIKCKCRDCKQEFTLRELQGGGQWCEECQTAGIES